MTGTKDMRPLLRPVDVAELLNVSRKTAYRLIERGELSAVHEGERAEKEAEAEAAARRRQSYHWTAGYFRLAAEAVRGLHRSRGGGKGSGGTHRLGRRRDPPPPCGPWARFRSRVIDQLDGRVVGGIPSGPKGRWAASDPQHLIGSLKANQRSADDYERLAALADELATEEEERTGNGTAA